MPRSPDQWQLGVTMTWTDDSCELCGATDRVAAIVGLRPGARNRPKLNICAACCALVLEGLTDFHFVNQLNNWDGMRANLRQRRPSATKVK